ncbi:MAG: hypothetical protein RLZZ67_21 [Candidatus Parcubacteria bacterium]|jgi:hypothetical protein
MITTYQVAPNGVVENAERYDLRRTFALFKLIFKNY